MSRFQAHKQPAHFASMASRLSLRAVEADNTRYLLDAIVNRFTGKLEEDDSGPSFDFRGPSRP